MFANIIENILEYIQSIYILDISLYILTGSINTFGLYIVTAIFSVVLGIIGAIGKIISTKPIRKVLDYYTWVFRGTPLLLQLIFIYYGFPSLGITLSMFQAASVTFIINYTAYLIEIFRAGIESIPPGQYEAAEVLGMNYRQTMMRIVLPQTIRRVLPPLGNEAINLVKDSALVIVIGMPDILRKTKEVFARDFNIAPFFVAAVFYLIISSLLVKVFDRLEEKYSIQE